MVKFGSCFKKMAREATSPDLSYLGLALRWSGCQPRSDEGHFCILWVTIIEVITC